VALVSRLHAHWPEYLIEAAGIGAFMISALCFTVLLEHPASPLHRAIPDPLLRRVGMGLAMGATSVTLVYSRYGKRSGAHFNPALTFTFFRLGKIEPADALLYASAQFTGGVLGVGLTALVLGALVAEPHVNFAATVPGARGRLVAFAAEAVLSYGLMLTVLVVSNHPRVARFTGLCAGALVALYISLEAPLSGMSMNPARTLGSAAGASEFRGLWIYFTAPPLGMLLAAESYVRLRPAAAVRCAKLHHQNRERCIFRCGYAT
jgi:aquaporin Z